MVPWCLIREKVFVWFFFFCQTNWVVVVFFLYFFGKTTKESIDSGFLKHVWFFDVV